MQTQFSLARKLNEEHGVTIIDVLINMAILAIGILAVAKMQVATARNTESSLLAAACTAQSTAATSAARRPLWRLPAGRNPPPTPHRNHYPSSSTAPALPRDSQTTLRQ